MFLLVFHLFEGCLSRVNFSSCPFRLGFLTEITFFTTKGGKNTLLLKRAFFTHITCIYSYMNFYLLLLGEYKFLNRSFKFRNMNQNKTDVNIK